MLKKSLILNKVGTPCFKNATPYLYNAVNSTTPNTAKGEEVNQSGDFAKANLSKDFNGQNIGSDKGSILNEIVNPKDFQSWSLDLEQEK